MSDRKRRDRHTSENSLDETNDVHSHDERESSDRRSARKSKRRRWPYLLLAILVLAALLPNLIGWTGLHQTTINYALAKFDGSVTIESMSTGWFQSVQLNGVTIKDAQGQPLINAASVKTSATLFHLMTKDDLGTIDIDQPEIFVELRPRGSNIEDAIANLAKLTQPEVKPDMAAQPSGTKVPNVQINLHSGRATLSSLGLPTRWQLETIDGEIRSGGTGAPLMLEISSRITPERIDAAGQSILKAPGNISLAGQFDAGQSTLVFESAEFLIETQQLPLSMLGPALQRALGPTATSGRMTGKMKAHYNAADQSVLLEVNRIDAEAIGFASPNLIGPDQVRIDSVGAAGDLQLTPNLIFAKTFSVNSDVGKLTANGKFDLNQLTQLTQQGRLIDSSFQMDGTIDLAKVVKMLPATLQLHQDLEVTAGTVSFQVNSQRETDQNLGRRLVVNVDTANLRAKRSGKEVVWAKPIRLVGTFAETNGQLSIENLNCESEFLNLKGGGNFQSASFETDGDLSILTERVGQFVDLDGTKLAGLVSGKFGWQAEPGVTRNLADPFENLPLQIGGNFSIDKPLIELPGVPRWQPSELNVKFSADALTRRRQPQAVGTMIDPNQPDPSGYALRLEEGGVQVDIGQERAIATLNEPVNDAFAVSTSRWSANCQFTGGLERWLAHAKNFVDLGPIQAAGNLNLTTVAELNGDSIEFTSAQYRVEQLGFDGYGLTLSEPSAEGQGTGSFNMNSGELTFADLTVIANSISARARDLKLIYGDTLQVNGDVAYRANVNRVAQWLALSPDADSLFWFGTAEGNVRFASDQSGIGMQTDTNIKDFVAAQQSPVIDQATGPIVQASNPLRQWNALVQDPKLRLFGGIKIGHDFDSIVFENTQLESESLMGTISGTANEISTRMLVDLKGNWKPDWSKINSLVAFYAGETLQFEGESSQSFAIRGPLFETPAPGNNNSIVAQPAAWLPSDVSGTANFGWERGAVLGLPVGKSQFDVSIDQGIATITTNGIPFAGGAIKFAPRVDLRTSQPVAKMDSTRLVENVELQPDTARQWLRYVAPLVADATSAQGTFTVDVANMSVPIFNPQQTTAQGSIKLSNVVIGAGPITEQLINSIKQVRQLLKPEATDRDLRTWLTLSEQTVPVVVRDGRVFHDNVKFSHKDLSVRTRGSVGFDQSLQLVAEIPIADDWIEGKKYLAGLKGQFLTIPISGTVSNPKIDRSSIDRLSRDLVQQAANSAVNNAVQDKLNPKINEFQQKINQKLNGQFNKLQQDFNKKLGIGGDKEGGSILPSAGDLLPGFLDKMGGGK